VVPSILGRAFVSPIFSAATKLRMAREWWYAPRRSNGDESVAALVERHYGAEMVDRLADPLLSGVYGGEASQLSARAVLPRLVEMESKHGSLGRGMLAARKNTNHSPSGPPIFTSLKGGMQQLSEALVAKLSAGSLRADSPVQAVQRQDRGWIVSAGYASDRFDAVIVATPATAAAPLLEIASADLAAELRAIPYSSSVTVTLGFDKNKDKNKNKDVRAVLPPGFGFLAPRSEGKRMLAATFVHNKFPHRAPENRALIRCFLGGSRDEQVLQLSDEEILGIVRDELREIVGLKAEPLFTRIYRWRGAMAQYTIGHLDRLARIESLLKPLPGLALAGNGYRGIGVPDCVRSGEEAVQQVLAEFL
jgi:oxygen-dependent protoporphyrinogen oxidase